MELGEAINSCSSCSCRRSRRSSRISKRTDREREPEREREKETGEKKQETRQKNIRRGEKFQRRRGDGDRSMYNEEEEEERGGREGMRWGSMAYALSEGNECVPLPLSTVHCPLFTTENM